MGLTMVGNETFFISFQQNEDSKVRLFTKKSVYFIVDFVNDPGNDSALDDHCLAV